MREETSSGYEIFARSFFLTNDISQWLALTLETKYEQNIGTFLSLILIFIIRNLYLNPQKRSQSFPLSTTLV